MSFGKISASMMCADLVHLNETIRIFEREKVEYLHIDVMDGAFVPNFGLGVDYIRSLRKLTDIPLDLHLMVMNPEYKLQWIGIQPTDIVSIHYESTHQVQRALDWLEPYRCKRFLAINPATPIMMLEEVLDDIDGINLLMVNPGFAGQKMVPSTMKKAKRLQRFLRQKNKTEILVEVDGNISFENAGMLRAFGADIFVSGSSSIFKEGTGEYEMNIRRLRQVISADGKKE